MESVWKGYCAQPLVVLYYSGMVRNVAIGALMLFTVVVPTASIMSMNAMMDHSTPHVCSLSLAMQSACLGDNVMQLIVHHLSFALSLNNVPLAAGASGLFLFFVAVAVLTPWTVPRDYRYIRTRVAHWRDAPLLLAIALRTLRRWFARHLSSCGDNAFSRARAVTG